MKLTKIKHNPKPKKKVTAKTKKKTAQKPEPGINQVKKKIDKIDKTDILKKVKKLDQTKYRDRAIGLSEKLSVDKPEMKIKLSKFI